MPETLNAHLYDYPRYYDLVYGSDWKAEFAFLTACFDKYAQRPVRSLFEPACGTGRLLIKFAQGGFDVGGNDLNPHAVAFCNERFQRNGLPPAAVVGDMAAFTLSRPVDAAYNMINSFRHLPDETAAESHLRCVAHALSEGGLYVLGLHLTPTRGERIGEESWSARRGNLTVISTLWSEGIDLRKRNERIGMRFDVYTPTRHMQLVDEMSYRTYTARQMRNLLERVPEFELVATHDFAYEIDQPLRIDPTTEDVVYILRKHKSAA